MGLSVKAGAAKEDLAVKAKTSIILESYEFGPAKNWKSFLNLIRRSRQKPQLNSGYNSGKVNNEPYVWWSRHVVYYDNSKYVTLELSLPSYNRYNMGGNAEPAYSTFYLTNQKPESWYQMKTCQ